MRGFLNGGSYEAIPLEVNGYSLEDRFRNAPRQRFSVQSEVEALDVIFGQPSLPSLPVVMTQTSYSFVPEQVGTLAVRIQKETTTEAPGWLKFPFSERCDSRIAVPQGRHSIRSEVR